MNRKLLLPELAAMLSESSGISKHRAEVFIRSFFNTIETGLQEDKLVKIKGFGTFKIVSVSSRESVSVSTGERITLDEHRKISFTPDSMLKELVNKPFSQFQTIVLDDDVTESVLEEVEQRVEKELATMLPEAEPEPEPMPETQASPADPKSPEIPEPTNTPEPSISQEEPAPTPLAALPTVPQQTEEKADTESAPTTLPKEDSTENNDTPDEVEETRRSIWKPILLILAGLFLFALGYMCGVKDIFGITSCSENAPTKNTPATPLLPDSLVADSLSADSTANVADSAATEAVTTEGYAQSTAEALPKHPDGNVRVNGQMGTHAVAKGESIAQIAVRYYGSKDYARHIIAFNELSNPDILIIGQQIKLPRIEVVK